MNRSTLTAASVLSAAALTGCLSHTVDVKPVEVKPVHITLDVNLKVERELDNYLDRSKTPVNPEIKPVARKVDGVDFSIDALRSRYQARKEGIADLKMRGVVGENSNGYLAFVTTKKEREELVREENRDRRYVYGAIAEKNSKTRDEIAAHAAMRHADRAKSGEFVMKNGEWQKVK